ncbi:MAG TPA: hypothetical protein VGH11_11590 [Jatrophihabitans sp.]|jgi:hypothetical protein
MTSDEGEPGLQAIEPVGAAATRSADAGSAQYATVLWLDRPEDHDYPAAAAYLSLLAGPKRVRALVAALRAAPVVHYKAKDILRASGLVLLPRDNEHVARDLARIAAGQPLSPCLMIRGQVHKWHSAQIADGYHRVCASYYIEENTDIPVKVVKL